MPCPFKICFTNKVNAICGGGQLLVTGWVPRSHYEGPGCQDVPCPRVASPKAQGSSSRVPGSHVSGSQCLGSQSLGSQGPGSQGLRIPGSQVSGLRVPGPGSQVLILDYARKSSCESILPDLDNKVLLQQLLSSEDLFKIHYNLSNIKQQKHSKLKTFPET